MLLKICLFVAVISLRWFFTWCYVLAFYFLNNKQWIGDMANREFLPSPCTKFFPWKILYWRFIHHFKGYLLVFSRNADPVVYLLPVFFCRFMRMNLDYHLRSCLYIILKVFFSLKKKQLRQVGEDGVKKI